MTPMEYIKNNVSISSARKLLYNCVFNKHKIEYEDIDGIEQEHDRKLAGTVSKFLNSILF